MLLVSLVLWPKSPDICTSWTRILCQNSYIERGDHAHARCLQSYLKTYISTKNRRNKIEKFQCRILFFTSLPYLSLKKFLIQCLHLNENLNL